MAWAPSSVSRCRRRRRPKPATLRCLRRPRDMTLDPTLGIPMVYLVDDEDVVRDALAWLLRSRRLLSEGFASAEAFEAHLATLHLPWPESPSCLLLDVRMPGT